MAERDLDKLLTTLNVMTHEGVWAFHTQATCPEEPVAMTFREREGWALIVPADDKDSEDNRWAWLELTVVSDLNAVGFIARIANALADAGIPCNAVAAFHHDHIFVPQHKADAAVSAILELRDQVAAPKCALQGDA
ncbi:MAG: ACT domain-containing protein [Pseudomonadota bacterium]